MKNWKLTVYEALAERLMCLVSLESSSLFLDIYLDALTAVVADRNRLRRVGPARSSARVS